MTPRREKHYLSVTADCPVMITLRVPWPMPRWRDLLRALTPVMRAHGCRQKDVYALDGLVAMPAERSGEDLAFVDRAELAFAGDASVLPEFWLYDWRRGALRLARRGTR